MQIQAATFQRDLMAGSTGKKNLQKIWDGVG